MARKRTKYDHMTASDLARETRALGLEKPDVLTLREWADWLDEQSTVHQQAPVLQQANAEFSDARATRLATLNGLTTHADLDAEAERLGVEWPAEGTGSGGKLLTSDKVNALMAAWDREQTGEGDGAETPGEADEGGI